MNRVEVWSDALWRLTTSVGPSDVTPGFSYLEPRRHIPYIADLDGAEARTLGTVISRASQALKEATPSDLVYIYVFGGGIPHLHFHLAPHTPGDALNANLITGEVEQRKLPGGATAIISKDFPSIPEAELRRVANRVRTLLA